MREDLNDIYLSFWHHVSELRTTLLSIAATIIASLFVCLFYSESLLTFLQLPLQKASPEFRFHNLILLSPLEGILISLKVSFFTGVIASSPLWIFLLMKFLFPGLKSHEKKMAVSFILVSIGFMALGGLFAFYVTIPLANQFFMAFNQNLGVSMWSLENYLNYTLFLMMANALSFELGTIGIFAVRLRLVSWEMLASKRRHAIVSALILGALLTPPDIVTQIMLAIPLILLYEALIVYARFGARAANTNTSGKGMSKGF